MKRFFFGFGILLILSFSVFIMSFNTSSLGLKTNDSNTINNTKLSHDQGYSINSLDSILTTPSPPQNLEAFPGNNTVGLRWFPPSSDGGSNITNYMVYRSISNNASFVLLSSFYLNINPLVYNDRNVTNSITYYYFVRAINSFGESAKSNEVKVTPSYIPSSPQNLQVQEVSNKVVLTWKAPISLGGLPLEKYLIFRIQESNLPPHSVNIANTTSTTYTDSNVTNGTYQYFVRALNADGLSPLTIVQLINVKITSTPKTTSIDFLPSLFGLACLILLKRRKHKKFI